MTALGLALDTATLFLAVSFGLSAAVHLLPAGGGDVAHREREARRRLLLPPVGAALILGLGFASACWEAWRRDPDHCGEAAVHPPYLCWLHPAGTSYHLGLPEAVALGVLAASALLVAREVASWLLAWRRLGQLRAAADPAAGEGLRASLAEAGLGWPGELAVVPSDQPVCFVYGWRSPRLVVSSTVLAELSGAELQHVIAHELAHVRRGDAFWRLVWQLAAFTHLPGLGRRAFAAWSLAGESVCDRAAAGSAGSSLAIAQTLIRFQRLVNHAAAHPLGAAFAHAGTLEPRVHQLLAPPTTSRLQRWARPWPWLAAALLAAQAGLVHQGLEALLRALHHA